MSDSGRNWPDWLPHPLWIRRVCPRCNSVKFKQSWVSCKFELVRSLSPFAVSMLTPAWLSRAQSTVTDINLTHCMESLDQYAASRISTAIGDSLQLPRGSR